MAKDPISAAPSTISPCPRNVSSTCVTWLTQIYCLHLLVAHGASRAHSYYDPALSCHVLWSGTPQLLVLFLGELPACSHLRSPGAGGQVPHETLHGHQAPRAGQHVKAEHSPAGCQLLMELNPLRIPVSTSFYLDYAVNLGLEIITFLNLMLNY